MNEEEVRARTRNGARCRKSQDNLRPRTAQQENLNNMKQHAQHRRWCVACVGRRESAMKHWRSAASRSDERRLHTFVMDYCLPSQGSQQRITVLVIKEAQEKSDQHVHGSKQRRQRMLRHCNCTLRERMRVRSCPSEQRFRTSNRQETEYSGHARQRDCLSQRQRK